MEQVDTHLSVKREREKNTESLNISNEYYTMGFFSWLSEYVVDISIFKYW